MFCSFLVVGALFKFSSNDREVQFLGQRDIERVKFLKSFNLDKDYSLLRFFENELYAISWTAKSQGKLFRLNKEASSFEEYKDFNRDTINTVIQFYSIQKENGQKTFYIKNDAGENSHFEIFYQDSLILDHEFGVGAVRLFYSDLNKILLTSWSKNFEPYFYKYSIKESTKHRIPIGEKVVKDLEYPGLELDGMFSYNEKEILFTSYFRNIVMRFDKNFNYKGFFRLNVGNPPFEVLYTSEHKGLISPDNLVLNLSVETKGKFMYVLTSFSGHFGIKGVYYIDKYNLQNESYIKSMKIAVEYNGYAPEEIIFNNDTLYILSDEKLSVYEAKNF